MTVEDLGIVMLIISLVLALILEVMPDYAEDRSKRYIRPKQRRRRSRKEVNE